MVSPPSSEREHEPYCEQANTFSWSYGLIRFSTPSPPLYEFQYAPPQVRSDPLSWTPPLIREASCSLTSSVKNWLHGSTVACCQVPSAPFWSDR